MAKLIDVKTADGVYFQVDSKTPWQLIIGYCRDGGQYEIRVFLSAPEEALKLGFALTDVYFNGMPKETKENEQ